MSQCIDLPMKKTMTMGFPISQLMIQEQDYGSRLDLVEMTIMPTEMMPSRGSLPRATQQQTTTLMEEATRFPGSRRRRPTEVILEKATPTLFPGTVEAMMMALKQNRAINASATTPKETKIMMPTETIFMPTKAPLPPMRFIRV